MSETTVNPNETQTPKEKPFFLKKSYVKTVVAAAAVTTVAYVIYKNRARFEDTVLVDLTDNVLTVTES